MAEPLRDVDYPYFAFSADDCGKAAYVSKINWAIMALRNADLIGSPVDSVHVQFYEAKKAAPMSVFLWSRHRTANYLSWIKFHSFYVHQDILK